MWGMIKPKKARKGDAVQVAHSVFADVIKLSENSEQLKQPRLPALRKRKKS